MISSGIYGYPMNEAFKVAVDTVAEFLMHNDMLVYIVVYNKNALAVGSKLFTDIAQYIDDNYVAEHSPYDSRRLNNCMESIPLPQVRFLFDETECTEKTLMNSSFQESDDCFSDIVNFFEKSFENVIDSTIDESFSEMPLRLIDERGMKDSECYKKANIDKRLFSKIRSNSNYKPSKPTVLAFCIALEANEMLMKAGFALSTAANLILLLSIL